MKRARIPLLVVALASLVYVVLVAFVAERRISFPYDVEWMEGGVLMQAERILRGDSAYPPPSATFVPFFYPPLYPCLVAGLGWVTGGVTYALGRGLSFGASVLGAGLGALAVHRGTHRVELVLLTIGLEAALASFGGSFLDLVRPDALAMALVMFGASSAMRGGPGRLVLAGLALAAACFAKQTAILGGLGVLAGVALTRDRRALAWVASTACIAGVVAFALLERASAGRFSFYVLAGHRSHAFLRDNFTFYVFRDVLHLAPVLLVVPLVWLGRRRPSSLLPWALSAHLGVALVHRAVVTRDLPHMYLRDLWYPHPLWAIPPALVAALALVGTRPMTASTSPHLRYWGGVFTGGLAAAAVGYSTQWAFKNSLMPLAVLGVPFVVLALDALAECRPTSPRWLALALAIQLVALYEPPSKQAPQARDREAWDRLRARVAAIPGKVMVLGHPRLAWEVGGGEHLHGMAITDLAATGGIPDLETRLAAHEWAAIVTDVDDYVDAPSLLARDYARSELLDVTAMKTGSRCRPAVLWLPRR
jgi:hypothetical protein